MLRPGELKSQRPLRRRHIACSTQSKSEIVVPLVHNGLTQLVLDIDSDELNAFDQIDQHYLELVVAAIARQNFSNANDIRMSPQQTRDAKASLAASRVLWRR
jgi:hypothetical protein